MILGLVIFFNVMNELIIFSVWFCFLNGKILVIILLFVFIVIVVLIVWILCVMSRNGNFILNFDNNELIMNSKDLILNIWILL